MIRRELPAIVLVRRSALCPHAQEVFEVQLEDIDDRTAAEVFRRLVRHLRHRADAENIDLMGIAGFCRNCLGDWAAEASGGKLSGSEAREIVYGMPYADWKRRHQTPATAEQLARLEQSLKRNETDA